jgi:hypothetical protein
VLPGGDLVGHRNSHITRTVYAHSIADKIGAAATVMDQIFSPESGQPRELLPAYAPGSDSQGCELRRYCHMDLQAA